MNVQEKQIFQFLEHRWGRPSQVELDKDGFLTRLTLIGENSEAWLHELWRFSQLQRLSLSGTSKGGRLPDALWQLHKLTVLSIKDTLLPELPAELRHFKQLRFLELGSNELQAVPKEIGFLGTLEALHIYNNRIQKLPAELGQLHHLTSLVLAENDLHELPEEIGKLTVLEELDISDNHLLFLPSTLNNLKQLKILEASRNELQILPEEVGKLESLEWLHLGGNQLKELPISLLNLKQLRSIDLSQNIWSPCHVEDLPLPPAILMSSFPGKACFLEKKSE